MTSRRSGRPAGRAAEGGDALAALRLVTAALADRKAMPPCWRRAPRTAARKDDGHATDRRDRGGARAIGRGAARGAVLRAEQSPVPGLRFPDHPNRALRALLLSSRAHGGVGRRADGR